MIVVSGRSASNITLTFQHRCPDCDVYPEVHSKAGGYSAREVHATLKCACSTAKIIFRLGHDLTSDAITWYTKGSRPRGEQLIISIPYLWNVGGIVTVPGRVGTPQNGHIQIPCCSKTGCGEATYGSIIFRVMGQTLDPVPQTWAKEVIKDFYSGPLGVPHDPDPLPDISQPRQSSYWAQMTPEDKRRIAKIN